MCRRTLRSRRCYVSFFLTVSVNKRYFLFLFLVLPCSFKLEILVFSSINVVCSSCWGYSGARQKSVFSIVLVKWVIQLPASLGLSTVVEWSRRRVFELRRRGQHLCCRLIVPRTPKTGYALSPLAVLLRRLPYSSSSHRFSMVLMEWMRSSHVKLKSS